MSADSLSVTTPTETEIVVTRVFDAPRGHVWTAMTDPKYLSRWLTGPDGWTMPVCETDVRPDGEYHFVWRKDDGSEMEMRGRYLEVVPPERLVSTEQWGPDWPETINTQVLREADRKTTLTLTIRYPSLEARDAALETGMTSGMTISYQRLDALLPEIA